MSSMLLGFTYSGARDLVIFDKNIKYFFHLRISDKRMISLSLFRYLFDNTWHALKNTKVFITQVPLLYYCKNYKGYFDYINNLPLSCEMCEKSFTRADYLERHTSKHWIWYQINKKLAQDVFIAKLDSDHPPHSSDS